jgi:hypothetical protein
MAVSARTHEADEPLEAVCAEVVGRLHPLGEEIAQAMNVLTAAIERERRRGPHASAAEWRRAATVRRLLEGETVAQAEIAQLGYELHARWHIGAIVVGDRAEEAVRGLKSQLGRSLLWVGGEPDAVWVWLGGQRRRSAEGLERLPSAEGVAGLSVAIGEPGREIEGWRCTHRQARETQALATRTPGQVARYGDTPLLASALNNETLAQALRVFVARLDRRGNGATLRRAVRAYIDLDYNTSSTASSLGVARHTAESYLRTAEELLGRTLCSCVAELDVGLRLGELERE